MEQLTNLIDDYKNNIKTINDISKILNTSEGWIRNYLHVNNISKHRNKRKDRKIWTNDELKYLKENYDKTHITDICNYLNRPEISIRCKANMMNIVKTNNIHQKSEFLSERQSYKYDLKYKDVVEKYLTIYQNHKTNLELSKDLNISNNMLLILIRRYNLPKISIINEEEYLTVYKQYFNYKDLANHFGISVIQLNLFINIHNLPKIDIILKHNTKWNTHQTNKLIQLHTKHTRKECAVLLNRSYESIKSKLKVLKRKNII